MTGKEIIDRKSVEVFTKTSTGIGRNAIVEEFLEEIGKSMKEKEAWWDAFLEVANLIPKEKVESITSFHESEKVLTTLVDTQISSTNLVYKRGYESKEMEGFFCLYLVKGNKEECIDDLYVIKDYYEATDYYIFSIFN